MFGIGLGWCGAVDGVDDLSESVLGSEKVLVGSDGPGLCAGGCCCDDLVDGLVVRFDKIVDSEVERVGLGLVDAVDVAGEIPEPADGVVHILVGQGDADVDDEIVDLVDGVLQQRLVYVVGCGDTELLEAFVDDDDAQVQVR